MKTIVIGAGSQLGSCLRRLLKADAIPLSKTDCDLTNSQQVWDIVTGLRADAVINTAAFTNVDLAEVRQDECMSVNFAGVHNLMVACRKSNIPLVHLSSDYVFGREFGRNTPYKESDIHGPLNVYGRSKIAGEEALLKYPKHLIVRTSGLYGLMEEQKGNGNFVESMLKLSRIHRVLSVVDDQRCSPSYVLHVARAILFLIEIKASGTYHVTNTGETTWYDFAREIFSKSDVEIELKRVSSKKYGAKAERPGYSVLDSGKYISLGGPKLPSWQEALDEYLEERSRLPKRSSK